MHSRLLPLNPPLPSPRHPLRRQTRPHVTLPSMPWLEMGFFAVLILGLMAVGA